MTTTKSKKRKGWNDRKAEARDLGTAEGVAEERGKGGGGGAGEKTFMHAQREDDALEQKLGEAAKEVKSCHLLAREAVTRLAAARMSTSTTEAIRHDLERVAELAQDIGTTARDALAALDR